MYEEVARLIADANVAFPDFGNGIPDEIINSSEKDLGFRFPDSFRWWLANYGGGQICDDLVYGIDMNNSCRPDVVLLYRNNIEDKLFNENQLVFSVGNEEIFYFQTDNIKNGEYDIFLKDAGQDDFLYANTFAEFLVKRIKELCNIV